MAKSLGSRIREFSYKRRQRAKSRKINRILTDINSIGADGMQRIRKSLITGETATFSPSSAQLAAPNYIGNNRRLIVYNGVYSNAWNLLDVYHAYTAESYLKFAVDSYVEGCLRNGYFIDSLNPAVTDYLNKRHKEFEIITGITQDELMRSMFFSLILYGNIFLSSYRSNKNSSGKEYTRFDGVTMRPIAGLYTEDPRRITVKKDGDQSRFRYERSPILGSGMRSPNRYNLGNIFFEGTQPDGIFASMMEYGRSISSMYGSSTDVVKLSHNDIFHIRYHAAPGEKWAMPPFYPALQDIETLRLIEENIELLMFQYGHPLYHGKVGEKDGRPGTQEEINDITAKMNAMESNGFLITDNRVDLQALGAEGKAVRAEEYLQYFKSRVYTSLWLSPVTTGEGGQMNRATADIVDKIKQDKTIEVQHVVGDAYQAVMIQLLREAGAPLAWILKPENIPTMKFNEVDMAKKVLVENNIVNQFSAGILTRSEARQAMGKKPLTKEQEKDTFQAISTTLETEAANKMQAAANSARNVVQPANQQGRKAGPTTTKNS